jgi:glycosyltransferase involved in cell wall biosynthesis
MSMRLELRSIGPYIQRLWRSVQAKLFLPVPVTGTIKVCVVVPAFPVLGGILTVLEGITQMTQDVWSIEYLVQTLGRGHKRYIIHQFGTSRMEPWHFPFDWLYVITGVFKFLALMRRGAGYHFLLPQDGMFSGFLAGLAGKLTGVRVVCVDHGAISLFTPRNSRVFYEEYIKAITTKKSWIARSIARTLLALHWPSRYLAARLAARLVDHYLIPGVPGDSSEEGCKILGIPPEHVTRFGSMIDIERYPLLDAELRVALREEKGVPADAIVVAIAARLSPEKGLDIALECIDLALAELDPLQRLRVRVIIAGDGPLREQLEQDVQRRGLAQTCLFWGELTSEEVKTLFSISDVFLYTSTRGACIPMAVLEAMASSCAVIASTEPLSNAVLLADGRGIAVPDGDVEQTRRALLRLLSDLNLCYQMGNLAREYIHVYHNPEQFKHVLLHITSLVNLDESINKQSRLEALIESGFQE